jgi:chitinase
MTKATKTPGSARTRVSFLRVGLVLICAAAISWGSYRAFADVLSRPAKLGSSTFAGYVDATVTPTYSFGTPSGPAESNVILSFVVADGTSGCTPLWGGAYTLDKAASDLELDRRISQLRSIGGSVRVSFGGQAGTELSVACTDAASLEVAYQSVVDRYKLTSIDLDVEGASLADKAAGARRAAAIKAVQHKAAAAGGHLAVWLTLPVSPTGLTAEGVAAVDQMLAAGVDLEGVNGMTMDFGAKVSTPTTMSDIVIQASTALRAQVETAYANVGMKLDDAHSWAKVGIIPMIGQNDVAGEVFTLADAAAVNAFARSHGVGQVSMWSLNRDSTCASPLPKILTVVQTSCSGVDQGTQSFADALALDLPSGASPTASHTSSTPPASPAASAVSPTAAADLPDDPAHSPFPIWDPLGAYPGGTKIVWHHNVYQARFWTSGIAPNTPVAAATDLPWTLVGPVLPGDTPAPLPTLPAGAYPQWSPTEAYAAGTRVQVGLVPYAAKWWSQGQEPGKAVVGGSPWVLVMPSGNG